MLLILGLAGCTIAAASVFPIGVVCLYLHSLRVRDEELRGALPARYGKRATMDVAETRKVMAG